MKTKFFALVVSVAGWIGCGERGTWVDTTSGTCLESQIEETRQHPELFKESLVLGLQVLDGLFLLAADPSDQQE
jgi:predicted NBD/HSP70 family sugar kinase